MRDGTEVQGCLPGHQYVLNHLAGLLVQRWVDKLVEAEDEKLVSFPQQFWSILVQQTELTEDLSTKKIIKPDVREVLQPQDPIVSS